jgi:GT2 family glycosyltransferase
MYALDLVPLVLAAVDSAVTASLVGAMLVVAVALGLRLKQRGIAILLLAVIVISPLRGALLSVTDLLGVPHRNFVVNAIQPALIAGAALGAIVHLRADIPRLPSVLKLTWLTILAVVLVNLPFHEGKLSLYAVGAVQYLSYPTFAVLAYMVGRRSSIRTVAILLVALGTAVAVTVVLEAVELLTLEQSRRAAQLGNPRYGGSTGSFLHASLFMGATIPIGLGLLLGAWSRPRLLDATVIGALLLGAISLTYGRGGIAVATLGVVILIAVVPSRARLRALGVCGLAVAVAIPLAATSGRSPSDIAERVSSSISSDDRGNDTRFRNMERAIDRFEDSPVLDMAMGSGVATTGNTGRVVSDRTLSTESYPLKLLLEVGLVGLLAIGSMLAWCAWSMARNLKGWRDPLQPALSAAGVALTLDLFIYQALEPQLLAMTWWLLVAIAVKLRTTPADEPLAEPLRAPRSEAPVAGRVGPDPRDGEAGLDVVIVSYRSTDLLRECLASLREHPPTRAMRVHVIDNDSGEETTSMVEREFPEVTLTMLAENSGFSVANNVGIDAGAAPYVLALNPDTRITPGALDRMLAVMDGKPGIGMAGPRLELEDGTFDHAARRSFPTILSSLGHFTGVGRELEGGALAAYRAPETDSGPVDAVNGAFMLMRRAALDEAGVFDEGYWMYMEDLDLCYRFAQSGWTVWYEPSVTVIHVKAGTSGSVRSPRLARAFHYGMFRFYRAHYASSRSVFTNLAVYCGIGMKAAISIGRGYRAQA